VLIFVSIHDWQRQDAYPYVHAYVTPIGSSARDGWIVCVCVLCAECCEPVTGSAGVGIVCEGACASL